MVNMAESENDDTLFELPPKKRFKKDHTQHEKELELISKNENHSISCCCYLSRRSLGNYNPLKINTSFPPVLSATCDFITKKLYKSVFKIAERPSVLEGNGSHGAIFNLEFSPNNQYLLAACEQKDILVYDPLSFKKVNVIPDAHREGVNCISFLDTRMFATCSDDENIAIWDIRNLNSRVFTLTGHTSWVKSINYDKYSGKLISSAFDDTVRCWDLKKNSNIIKSEIILKVPFLTRTKLSSKDDVDNTSKLYLATNTGLLFVIHNLNVSTLKKDTDKEMQFVGSSYLSNSQPTPFQKRNFNQIELVRSFPSGNKPWCIASIQLHPTEDMVLSRYTNKNIDSEWSVVHSMKKDSGSASGLFPQSFNLRGFIEEPNSARGYIKELCYSKEGWIICSPFGNGVRLLTLNENENHAKPQKLTEIKMITGHKNHVLTTRFSPYFPSFASGCRGGKVVFHQPVL